MLSHMDVVNVDIAGAFIDQMIFQILNPHHKERLCERILRRHGTHGLKRYSASFTS